MENKILRIFTSNVKTQKGIVLEEGTCFLVPKNFSPKYSTNSLETCLIYVDNGGDNWEEFDQHILFKTQIIEKSKEF